MKQSKIAQILLILSTSLLIIGSAKIDTSAALKNVSNKETKEDLYTLMKQDKDLINQQNLHKKLIEIEEREQKEKERLRKLEEQKRIRQMEYSINSKGFKIAKEVTCHITYFYGDNNSLQGGFKDKKGKLLSSHNEPICALPSDVNYGSYLILDEPIHYNTNKNISERFKNVDTGGAIKWINNNTLKVDIYVANCTNYNWIINNLKNKIVKGKLYEKY